MLFSLYLVSQFYFEIGAQKDQTIQMDTKYMCNLSHHLDQLEAIKMCTTRVLMQSKHTHTQLYHMWNIDTIRVILWRLFFWRRSHCTHCTVLCSTNQSKIRKSTCWQFIATKERQISMEKQHFEIDKSHRSFFFLLFW